MSFVSDWIRSWSMFRTAPVAFFLFAVVAFFSPVRSPSPPTPPATVVSGSRGTIMLSRLSMMVAFTGGSPELSVMEFSLSYDVPECAYAPPVADVMPDSGVEARCFVFFRIISVMPSSSTCSPSRGLSWEMEP
uniref:Uncharacterized protein n=1 Tax=Anopheles coluzzii TaxID=1518534 RepID=A0A8W7PBA6_ANOCL